MRISSATNGLVVEASRVLQKMVGVFSDTDQVTAMLYLGNNAIRVES